MTDRSVAWALQSLVLMGLYLTDMKNWLWAILLIPAIASKGASADSLVEYWRNETQSTSGLTIGGNFTYYSTTTNFDSSGNTFSASSLGGLQSYQRYYIDLPVTYGFNENIFAFGRLSFVDTSITSSLLNSSTFNLGDQLLGGAWRFITFSNGADFSVQAEVNIPAYSNSGAQTNGNPWAGDGSTDITGSVFGELPFTQEKRDWYLEAGGGYTWRNHGFSSDIPLSLMLKHEPAFVGPLFTIGAQAQVSLNTDKENIVQAGQDSLYGASGSYMIGAVNPSWFMLRGSLGYRLKNGPDISMYTMIPLIGDDTTQGVALGVGFTFHFTSDKPQEEEPTSTPLSTPTPQATPSPEDKKQVVAPAPAGPVVYTLVAAVSGFNDRVNLIKVNKGSDDGVAVGQQFDIFKKVLNSSTGEVHEEKIARGKVMNVKGSEAALSVVEYYQEQWIELNDIARRLP